MPTIARVKSSTCFQCCTWRPDSAVVGNDTRWENGPEAPQEESQQSLQASQSSPGLLLLGMLVRSLSPHPPRSSQHLSYHAQDCGSP